MKPTLPLNNNLLERKDMLVYEAKKQEEPAVQESVLADDEVFDIVEVMPSFIGGDAKMMEFLSKNIRYPKEKYDETVRSGAFQ